MKYFEEISNLKLSDNNLEKKRMKFFNYSQKITLIQKMNFGSKIFSLKMN